MKGQSDAHDTLADLLMRRATLHPERPACSFLKHGEQLESSLTYSQLDRRAHAIAASLQADSRSGQPVLLVYPPGLDFVEAFHGCIAAAALAVPVVPPDPLRLEQTLPAFRATIRDAQPAIALTTSAVLPIVRSLSAQVPELSRLHWEATDLLPEELHASWQRPAVSGDDLAFLQYTSGSTGTPRGVMVSHANLVHNTSFIQNAFGLTDGQVGASWLPLYHDMGLIGMVLANLKAGMHVVLMSPADFLQRPIRWLQAISRYRAYLSTAPNFAYEVCARRATEEDKAQLELSCWQRALNGAEPVRADTLARFAAAFAGCGFSAKAFRPCYGLAEATLCVSGAASDAEPTTFSADVRALESGEVRPASERGPSRVLVACGDIREPGQRLAIVDPLSCSRSPEDRVGEIWVSSPSVALGYWRRPSDTEACFGQRLAGSDERSESFLRTGDLGFIRDNKLFITGRQKDLIIVAGKNHHPEDIEQTVDGCAKGIRPGRCAAFSIEDHGAESLAIACEVDRRYHERREQSTASPILERRQADRRMAAPDPGHEPDQKGPFEVEELVRAIRRAVAERHGLQVCAIALVKPGALPRTTSGKTKRSACRALFLGNKLDVLVAWRVSSTESESSDWCGVALTHKPAAAEIENWIVARLAHHLRLDPVSIARDRPFSSQGLDSKGALILTGELQDWLQRDLPSTLIWEHATISQLARHLADGAADDTVPGPRARGASAANETIAIVGMACRFPGAPSLEAFWQLLQDGTDAIVEVPLERWDIEQHYHPEPGTPGKMCSRFGGFIEHIDEFDAAFFGISAREAVQMDPQQRLLLELAWEALERGGIPPASIAGSTTGVFIGGGAAEYHSIAGPSLADLDGQSATGVAPSLLANRLSYVLDLRGPSVTIDTACSSSLVAVHLACQALRRGDCDLTLAAGVNLILSPWTSVSLSQARMLSPAGKCKTFSDDADGYVRGEGCGVVVLRRLSDAVAAGDEVRGLIVGSALNHGGRSLSLTGPNGAMQKALVRQALAEAGIPSSALGYVEAHGTGTALGDPIEFNALAEILVEGRPADRPCWIGSVKTNIGHLEAAAGIAGLIKAALALEHDEIPAHLNLRRLNPALRIAIPLRIPARPEPWPRTEAPRFAGVSSFGFGGTNAHVVLREVPAPPRVPLQPDRPLHIMTVSARSPAALRALVARHASWLQANSGARVADFCYSANAGRQHFSHRLAIVARSSGELRAELEDSAACRAGEGVRADETASPARPLAFFFSGEGEPALETALELYKTSPIFRAAVDECEQGRQLTARTDHAAAAPFAIQYGLGQLWRSWGIEPEFVGGCGQGEYAAACIAGVLSVRDAVRLAATRAPLSALGENSRSSSIGFVPGGSGKHAIDSIRTLHQMGVRVFLEIGAQADPASRASAFLDEKGLVWLPGLNRDASGWECLLAALRQLYLLGADIDWHGFDRPYRRPKLTLPTYPYQRRRFWPDLRAPVSKAPPPDQAAASTDTEAPVVTASVEATDDLRRYYRYLAASVASKSSDETAGAVAAALLRFAPFLEPVPGFSWLRTLARPHEHARDFERVLEARAQMTQVLFRGIDFSTVQRVLDFGCGYATDLIELAKRHAHLSLDGCNISPEQLAIAKSLLEREGLAARVHLFELDSAKEAFPAHYELVLGFQVIHHIPEKPAIFANIGAHLRNGGYLLLAEIMSNTGERIEHRPSSAYFVARDEWADLLARNRLRIVECVDAGREVSNFLYHPNFSETLTAVAGGADSSTRAHLQGPDRLGGLLARGLASYALLTIQKDMHVSPSVLRAQNEEMLGSPASYAEVLGRAASMPFAAGGDRHDPAAGGGLLAEVRAAAAGGERQAIIQRYLIHQVIEVLRDPHAKVDLERELADLGVDSLMALELHERIAADLGVAIDVAELVRGHTLAQICADLLGQIASGRSAPSAADLVGERRVKPDLRLDEARDPEVGAAMKADSVLDADIEPARALPYQHRRDDAVLVTGASGFVGAFIAAEICRLTEAPVYCLVRARDNAEAANRLEANLQNQLLQHPRLGGRLIAVRGDLAQRQLGLEHGTYASLAEDVGKIFHIGYVVNMLWPYFALRNVNVQATREILRFASTHRVKAVHFMSSLGVFLTPEWAGKSVLESDIPVSGVRGYGQTKCVSEHLLRAAIRRGLPCSIYRAPFCGWHSETGVFNPRDWLTRLLMYCLELGAWPELDVVFPVTPVDFVAQALVHIAQQESTLGNAFHLIGEPDSLSWASILNRLSEAGVATPRIPYSEWRAKLVLAEPRNPMRAFLPMLPTSQDRAADSSLFLAFQRDQMPSRFDARNALAALGDDVHCSPFDARLLTSFLRWVSAPQGSEHR